MMDSRQEKENLLEKVDGKNQVFKSYVEVMNRSREEDASQADRRDYGLLIALTNKPDIQQSAEAESEKHLDISGEISRTENVEADSERMVLKEANRENSLTSPRRSPNNTETSPSGKNKANKKGLQLHLDVSAARDITQRHLVDQPSLLTPGLTPGGKSPKPMNVNVFTKEGERIQMLLETGQLTKVNEIKMKMLERLDIPTTASHIFSIWLISPHLELQLKDRHKPVQLRKLWPALLKEFSLCKEEEERIADEPVLVFQRNSFLSTAEEEKVTDENVIKRLYEEAKHNILNARYPIPVGEAELLGGYLARVELGPFDPQKHKPGFFKKTLSEYLPYYAIGSNKLVQIFRHSSTEQRLLDQYSNATSKYTDEIDAQKALLKYCRDLDFYGCAFFKGIVIQDGIEIKPWKSCEKPVVIGINRLGVTLFGGDKAEVLIHLRYEDLSWKYDQGKKDSHGEVEEEEVFYFEYDIENDSGKVPQQVQIVSNQACMMDAMVTSCVNFMNIMNTPKTPTSADYTKILDISYSTYPSKKQNFSLTRPFNR